MKKPMIQEYQDKIAYGYTVTGIPRVRAEWNWNETSKLALPANNGVYMYIFIPGTGYVVNNTGSLTEAQRKARFDAIFQGPIRRRFVSPTPSFTSNNANQPNFSYEIENGEQVKASTYFGLEMFFQLDLSETGTYQFYGSSDDSYEVYITTPTGTELPLFNPVGTAGGLKFYDDRGAPLPPTYSENFTIALTPGRHRIRVRFYNETTEYGIHLGYRTPSMIAGSITTPIYIDGTNALLPDERGPKENPEPFTPNPSNAAVKEWAQYKALFPLESVTDPHRPISGIRYNMLQKEPDNNPLLPGSPTFGANEDLYPDAYIMAPQDYITTHNEAYARATVRGEWHNGTEYFIDDVVTWNDRDYIALVDHVATDLIDFTKFKLLNLKPKRYYCLHKYDQKYKYWVSETQSSATANGFGFYDIEDAGFIVHYEEPVSTNKVSVTFNLGAMPKEISLDYYGWLPGEDTDSVAPQWHEIFGPGDVALVNPYTGEFQFWYTTEGGWTQQQTQQIDNSVKLSQLRLQVQSIDRKSSRLEVIEASARKELDLSNRVIQFNFDLSMDEQDFMRLIGEVSANGGSIELSDWDNAFELDEGTDDQKLEQVKSRRTKFTFDIVYDLEGTTYAPRYYPVRIATMHSADWSRQGEFDYTIQLFDSGKLLQNIDSTEFFEKAGIIHILVAQLCDSVGFDRYQFDRYDYDALLNSTVLDYFAPNHEDTVWQSLQKIARATLCAIFFDEYDVLQLMTKEEITNAEWHDVEVPVSLEEPNLLRKIPKADYVLRGQPDSLLESPFDSDPDYDIEALPNIVELSKNYDQEANKVKILYRPRSVKTTGLSGNNDPLTDIVWKSDDDIVLRATRLLWPLPATSVYSQPDNNTMYFFIAPGDVANLWPYKGKANINGEIVEWNGKEYKWLEKRQPGDPMYPGYIIRYEVLYSEADRKIRDLKTGSGYQKVNNAFTGKMRLLVDDKKKKVTGRAIDYSKYQVEHPTWMRPGWQIVRTVLGDPGVFNGTWPGEQNSSFYVFQDSATSTSLEINRPTNANDDWFKTQAIMRSSSPGTVLQQWGFRFKFKQSATMGEISLMFNMGTALGGNFGSQVVNTLLPSTFNQMYQISFLETQGIVRDVAHEIAAWVQSPDPLYRTHDNAVRGGASRMYNRNYHESWADRMKGYRWEFKRDQWYDIKVDLTRGRGYSPNHDMHFFVWVNGIPAGGFAAAGPPDRHLWLPPTNHWAIGFRAASKVEIENAYSWTEFGEVRQEDEQTRQNLTNGSYASAFLEEGLLYPAKGKSAPYRDQGSMDGEFFFDDFGSVVHEVRDFDVELDKAPAEGVSWFISNENVKMQDIEYSPNQAKFSIVNVTNTDQIVHGQQDIGQKNTVNHQMILYGYVLTEGEEATVEKQNTVAIRDRGEVKYELTADWINTRQQADDLADWIVDHFSEPMDVLTIEVFGDASFSIGDKLRIFYDKAAIDKDWLYIVSRVQYEYGEGLKTSITARRVRNNETDGVITH